MEKQASIVEALYERVEAYSKTTLELSKLKALNTTTHVVTTMISRLSVIIMLALFALVLNIGIALWLGELLGKNYYGFFIVALFYLIAAIVLHFFLHNWIKKPVSDLIITQALQ
jgi:phosphoglycerol transferase MdoB-like AlkP superfamily enzyme